MMRVGRQNAIHDLFPPDSAKFITPAAEVDTLETLEKLNREHLSGRPGDSRLEARIHSYEMAAKLQVSAPEVLDISGESEAVKKLYGLDEKITADFGQSCLVARRLLERGVRFIQLWSGADNGFPRRNWDSHEDLVKDHGGMAKGMDQPAAALIKGSKSPRSARRHDRLLDHRSSAACLAAKAPRAAITTPFRLPVGWPAAA